MSQLISIEGNIGSGKSTILKLLKEKFNTDSNIIFLQEPVEEWEKIKDKNNETIISKFYENQEKYSFAFQMMAYISRLSILQKAIRSNPEAIILTERCLNTDRYVFAKMLYDSGKLEEVEYQIYLRWFDHFINTIDVHKTIYLKTDPSICYHRVNKRCRDGEENISLDNLQNCHNYHENMINNINKDNLLVINANIDNDENKKISNQWISEINDFIIKNKV